MPDRRLDGIIYSARAAAVGRLNLSLPCGVSIDISAVDLTPIRDQLRREVADRLTEVGGVETPNDPVIARRWEMPNGSLQTDALQIVTARLDSPNRLLHFFGKVLQEGGQGMRLVESPNDRADRLAPIFSYIRRNPEDALLYGRTADQPADQEPIANRASALA